MKKFLSILIVLSLAGVANASFIEEFDDYDLDEGLQPHRGWTTSHQNKVTRNDATIMATGIGGTNGADALDTNDFFGASKSETSGNTHTVRMLFNDDGGSFWNFVALSIGEADYLDEPNSNHIWAQFGQGNGGSAKLVETAVDVPGENAITYVDTGMVDLGWYEAAISVDLSGEGTAEAFYRDVDDSTGSPASAWTTIGSFPSVSVGTVGAVGFTVAGGYTSDNFVSEDGYILRSQPQISGDFDSDSDVDGDDFLAWQNGFPIASGAVKSGGDADGDGDVDGDDFLIWQNNFPYPGVVATTPEPASFALLALGGLMMLKRRRM